MIYCDSSRVFFHVFIYIFEHSLKLITSATKIKVHTLAIIMISPYYVVITVVFTVMNTIVIFAIINSLIPQSYVGKQ